jgi:hypothetical protein
MSNTGTQPSLDYLILTDTVSYVVNQETIQLRIAEQVSTGKQFIICDLCSDQILYPKNKNLRYFGTHRGTHRGSKKCLRAHAAKHTHDLQNEIGRVAEETFHAIFVSTIMIYNSYIIAKDH